MQNNPGIRTENSTQSIRYWIGFWTLCCVIGLFVGIVGIADVHFTKKTAVLFQAIGFTTMCVAFLVLAVTGISIVENSDTMNPDPEEQINALSNIESNIIKY